MMIHTMKTHEQYKEMTEALRPLGFTPQMLSPGFYYHEHMEGIFDFSAHSIEGVAMAIFMKGQERGESDARADIGRKFKAFTDSIII